MGRVSVAQVPQDVPGNASREVFQGLFKDLGKQAMALEAILRAVCGRVDKLENWLTEVSFGMTELDLKLRNIAHNIDGTAAVDDEAQGRWAIPPADDVKPLAPTVSKKLGIDKKALRVTGMAAAILDQLATTNTTTPTTVEFEKVEKNGMKKKSKDKKHGAKKAKPNGLPEVPVTLSPAAVDTAAPPAIPLPSSVANTKPMIILEVELVEESISPQTKSPPSSEQIPAPQVNRVEAAEQEVVPAPTIDAPLEQVNTIVDNKADSADAPDESNSVVQPVLPKNDQMEEENATLTEPIHQSGSKSSPAISPREATRSNESMKASSTKPEVQVEVNEEPSLVNTSSVSINSAKEEPNVTTPTLIAPKTPAVDVEPAPSAAKVSLKPSYKAPTPSVSSVLPTVQVERVMEPFVLNVSAQTPSVAAPSSSSVPPTSVPEAPPVQTVVPTDTSNNSNVQVDSDKDSASTALHHLPPPLSDSKPTVASDPNPVVTKAIRAVGVPIRAKEKPASPRASESTADPLLPHRTTAHRRSSKFAPRPSFSKKLEQGAESDAVRRLSGNKRGSQSRRMSIASQGQIPELESQTPTQQSTPQPPTLQSTLQELIQSEITTSPTLQSVPQELLQSDISTSANTPDQADINEESSESGSESSLDGSGSSSGEEEHEEDKADEEDEDTEAAEEISKAMTALKKLKRAHMLSPEEESELKERAHKKWFQLKGHIKEKQKKDVTNILLKRKKNVFTVSSRIELLEEKSREIFAALKQFTNEMREKNDRATHETLRRRVADIEQSLQSIDSRIASLSAPAVEKVNDMESEVVSLRTTVQLQLTTAQSEATIRHSMIEEALARQRALVESLTQDVPTQLNAQAELFIEKLKQLPDFTAAIENLRRSLRRKADLKLLKEYVRSNYLIFLLSSYQTDLFFEHVRVCFRLDLKHVYLVWMQRMKIVLCAACHATKKS